jgi:hypothetical protein
VLYGGRATCLGKYGRRRHGMALVPERNPGKAHPGRNEQRFFDVAERQWRSLGPVLEWAFGHREPQTESPRSSAVQSLEEWVFPDLMQ